MATRMIVTEWHKQLIRDLAWEGYSTREIAGKTGVRFPQEPVLASPPLTEGQR